MSDENELPKLRTFSEWLTARLAVEMGTDTSCVANFSRPLGTGSSGRSKVLPGDKKKKKKWGVTGA